MVDSYADFGTTFANYYVDSGTTNNYVITPSPALTSYVAGTTYAVRITNANTGNSTINVSGLGAKAITYIDGTGLSSGAMPLNSVVLLFYDGTQFQLVNITPTTGSSGITALTGDVTASGSGSVAATIANNAVTLAKLATQAANTVLTNATAGTAVPTALSLGASTVLGRDSSGNISALTLSGLTAISGVLTASGGGLKGIQYFSASGTYTKTTGTTSAIIFCQGGGGGGGGDGGAGGVGGASSFGSQCSANGGAGGVFDGAGTGGAGGTASGGVANLTGQSGQKGVSYDNSSNDWSWGGDGGSPNFLGGYGYGEYDAQQAAAERTATAGALGGGGGGYASGDSSSAPGGGGGSGGLAIELGVISGTETITIGAAGTAGSSGGAAGGAGYILVIEF